MWNWFSTSASSPFFSCRGRRAHASRRRQEDAIHDWICQAHELVSASFSRELNRHARVSPSVSVAWSRSLRPSPSLGPDCCGGCRAAAYLAEATVPTPGFVERSAGPERELSCERKRKRAARGGAGDAEHARHPTALCSSKPVPVSTLVLLGALSLTDLASALAHC